MLAAALGEAPEPASLAREHPGPGPRDLAELADRLAEERMSAAYYLEAIVIGGIVAASYLNAAFNILH